MSSVAAISHSVRITSAWRLAATWIGASVIAVPLGVLLHELGHFVAYWAFGFQGVALHYASATHSVERTFWQLVYTGKVGAAAALLPLWKVGLGYYCGNTFHLRGDDCLLHFRSEEKSAPAGDRIRHLRPSAIPFRSSNHSCGAVG